jgi:predicted TIM-barrel fold metal-dependent hydrolase
MQGTSPGSTRRRGARVGDGGRIRLSWHEDDIAALKDQLSTDQLLFGSDFPHAEGLAEPTNFVADLDDFSPEEIRRVMRDNGLRLLEAP